MSKIAVHRTGGCNFDEATVSMCIGNDIDRYVLKRKLAPLALAKLANSRGQRAVESVQKVIKKCCCPS